VDLFSKIPVGEVKLEPYKPPVKKAPIEKVKVEKRINKVSNDSIPMFSNETLRLKLFPNNPPLKPKMQTRSTGNIRWVNGKYRERK